MTLGAVVNCYRPILSITIKKTEDDYGREEDEEELSGREICVEII